MQATPRTAAGDRKPASGPEARARRIVHFPSEIDVNPYTRLLYDGLARLGFELVPDAELTLRWLWRSRDRVGLLHFHWYPNNLYEYRGSSAHMRVPASWLRLGPFVARLAVARLLGYRLLWTVHEVRPHESISHRLDRAAARVLARLSSVLLAHDAATAERARGELGRAASTIKVVPHGSYIGFYPRGRARALVREDLGIPEGSFAFLAFGSLKPYKRVELLLEAFLSLRRADVALVLAGSVQPRFQSIGDAVLAAAARDTRIRARLGLVPDERVAELFEACDAAVLARGDGSTSGALVLALSQGLPVVAAQKPAYEELTSGGSAGWLFSPDDPESLRAAMEAAAADPALALAKGGAALELAERLSWNEAAERIAHLLAPQPAPGDAGRPGARRVSLSYTSRHPDG